MVLRTKISLPRIDMQRLPELGQVSEVKRDRAPPGPG
jgi:hypothetical protein